MKAFNFISICLAGAMTFASCSNVTSDAGQPAGITKAEVDSVSYMMGYSLGMNLEGSNFGALNVNQIVKGIKAAAEGVEISQQDFYQVVSAFMEKRNTVIGQANIEKEKKFFAENGKKEGVVTTESGLQYKIEKEGTGVKPTSADTVEVNYEGTTLEGKVFDSSEKAGRPLTIPLNRVIPGWTEGMQYVAEGGEITLWIPAALAYGPNANGGVIGPNEPLKFKVELISVKSCATTEESAE